VTINQKIAILHNASLGHAEVDLLDGHWEFTRNIHSSIQVSKPNQ